MHACILFHFPIRFISLNSRRGCRHACSPRPDADRMIKHLKKRICLVNADTRCRTVQHVRTCGDCISVGIEPVIPSWRCWSRKTHSWPLLWHAVGVIPLMLTDLLAGMQRFFDETYIELCFFSLHACFGFRKSCIVFLLWSVHSEFSALLGYFFYS